MPHGTFCCRLLAAGGSGTCLRDSIHLMPPPCIYDAGISQAQRVAKCEVTAVRGRSGMKVFVCVFDAGVMGMLMRVGGGPVAFFDTVEFPNADRETPGEQKYPDDDVA
jgi:hypothetical protein